MQLYGSQGTLPNPAIARAHPRKPRTNNPIVHDNIDVASKVDGKIASGRQEVLGKMSTPLDGGILTPDVISLHNY